MLGSDVDEEHSNKVEMLDNGEHFVGMVPTVDDIKRGAMVPITACSNDVMIVAYQYRSGSNENRGEMKRHIKFIGRQAKRHQTLAIPNAIEVLGELMPKTEDHCTGSRQRCKIIATKYNRRGG